MKKIFCFLLCFVMQIVMIQADSWCVMIDGDNTIVEENDMHKQQSVASISKIMTALIAIEKGNLTDTWKTGEELNECYGSMIYLTMGQEVSLESMLYGLMLRSGNDAAMEIAVHIAKSENEFVEMMNEKAVDIGMLNTEFHNASGLDEEDGGNISTAYDMAILMSYAMKNETFRKITSTQYYTSEWNYRWQNKNRLLFDYAYANGGKTGFTKLAGRTLVSSANLNGVESIVVSLRTSDDFAFHKEMHTKVLSEYEVIALLLKGTYHANGKKIIIKDDINMSVKKDGSDKVSVSSHFEKNKYIIEVQKNDQIFLYEYDAEKNKEVIS